MLVFSHVSAIATLFVFLTVLEVNGFPDGGPVDSCVKPKPNQPYHGQTKPQPANTNPYKLLASSDRYQPGSQITGVC